MAHSRVAILGTGQIGASVGLALKTARPQTQVVGYDASGDSLDAVLCLVQAAWAQAQGAPGYGLPPHLDPLEGWILTC